MSQWICEDVGLFINQQRDKLSELLNEYTEKEGETMDPENEGIIKGINFAYDILDELADDWTSDNPSDEVKNIVKKHYGEDFI